MQDPLARAYDAIVVGSGATGGWAAKRLSEAGLNVAILEAGRNVSPSEFTDHMPEWKLRYRNLSPEIVRTRPIQKMCYACTEHNYDWFVDDLQNPYSTPKDKPFTWQRLRVVGGRTLVWGRQCYRLSDLDFKAASFDGYGQDWPISYAELAPYYDLVENYVGISGDAAGNPVLPDGRFLPPMALTCGEIKLRDSVKQRFGRTLTIGRTAMLTKSHNGRAACHYCGPCERGCQTFSYFSSPFTTVKDAIKTGKCTLIPNAVVAHLDLAPDGTRAAGVTFVDRVTRQTRDIRARVVILCAQAMESTRILLNTATREKSKGLGNSSGLLGRGLMDHAVGAGARGEFTEFPDRPSAGSPYRANGIYVIRFRNVDKNHRHPAFLRGYGFQGRGGPEFDFAAEGFGAGYKKAVKHGKYSMTLTGFGESLARDDNFIEIDPELRDAWGIPALRIQMTHGENERTLMKDATAAAAEMLEAAGAKNIALNANIAMAGMAIHELGTARMGTNPKKSVLTPYNQLHDVPNVFVMDGSCFVSSACQNPTLTMMALTVRACEHLVDRFKKREI